MAAGRRDVLFSHHVTKQRDRQPGGALGGHHVLEPGRGLPPPCPGRPEIQRCSARSRGRLQVPEKSRMLRPDTLQDAAVCIVSVRLWGSQKLEGPVQLGDQASGTASPSCPLPCSSEGSVLVPAKTKSQSLFNSKPRRLEACSALETPSLALYIRHLPTGPRGSCLGHERQAGTAWAAAFGACCGSRTLGVVQRTSCLF